MKGHIDVPVTSLIFSGRDFSFKFNATFLVEDMLQKKLGTCYTGLVEINVINSNNVSTAEVQGLHILFQ